MCLGQSTHQAGAAWESRSSSSRERRRVQRTYPFRPPILIEGLVAAVFGAIYAPVYRAAGGVIPGGGARCDDNLTEIERIRERVQLTSRHRPRTIGARGYCGTKPRGDGRSTGLREPCGHGWDVVGPAAPYGRTGGRRAFGGCCSCAAGIRIPPAGSRHLRRPSGHRVRSRALGCRRGRSGCDRIRPSSSREAVTHQGAAPSAP